MMNIPKPLKYLILLLVAGACVAGLYFFRFSPGARAERALNRAGMYFEAGEYGKAKIEYINVLRHDMRNAEAVKRLGLIWLEQGSPQTALPFLIEGRKLSPDDRELHKKLAVTALTLGDVAEAERLAAELLEADPGNGEALVLLADTARKPEARLAVRKRMESFPNKNTAAFHLANASLLVKEGNNVPAALAEAEKAVEAEPSSHTAWLTAAALHLKEKDVPNAALKFQKGSELAPLRSSQRLKFAEFKMQQGDTAGARELVSAVLAQAPDFLSARILLAQIDFAERKHEAAAALMGDVLKVDPRNFTAAVMLARMWQQTAQPAKAVEVLENVLKLFPKHPVLRMELARAHAQNGSALKAVDLLNQLSGEAPDSPEPVLMRAELNIRTGQAQAAVTELSDLLKKRPQTAQAAELLSLAYQELGRTGEAVSVARQLTAAAPENARFHLLLGRALLRNRAPEEAREAFEKARELNPGDIAPVSLLVDLDRMEGRSDQAMERIAAFLAARPDSAEAHFVKSKILIDRKDQTAAEEALAKAIELDADFSPAYEMLIQIYVGGGRIPEATRRLEEMLIQRPADERALLLLALLQQQQGEYQKARDSYEKILALKPDRAVAWNNLAMLCASHLDDLDRAYEAARKARQLRPAAEAGVSPGEATAAASVADTLGWVLYLRGEYAEALTLLREAAGGIGSNPEVQYHLGMAAYMMGQKDAARVALRTAASAAEDFPGKQEARSRLALLGDSPDGAGGGAPAVQTVAELEETLKANPSDTLLLDRLAEAYEREGDWPKAAEAYERALQLNPALAVVTGKLAVLYAGPLADKAKARELGRKARELEPDNPAVAGLSGLAALRAGDFARAYSLLGESARRADADARNLHGLGWAAYSLGKVQEAREAMRRAAETSAASSPEATDARTFLALTAEDADAASGPVMVVSPEEILRKDPRYVPALMARGAEKAERGETAGAIADYQAALASYPDFAPAQTRLAALYAEDPAQRAQAYELARKARSGLPNDPGPARILGELSCYRKDFTYAETLLLESHRGKPLDARGLYFLGMARFEKGNREPAKESLNQAVAAGLAEPLLADARRMLAELEKTQSGGGS